MNPTSNSSDQSREQGRAHSQRPTEQSAAPPMTPDNFPPLSPSPTKKPSVSPKPEDFDLTDPQIKSEIRAELNKILTTLNGEIDECLQEAFEIDGKIAEKLETVLNAMNSYERNVNALTESLKSVDLFRGHLINIEAAGAATRMTAAAKETSSDKLRNVPAHESQHQETLAPKNLPAQDVPLPPPPHSPVTSSSPSDASIELELTEGASSSEGRGTRLTQIPSAIKEYYGLEEDEWDPKMESDFPLPALVDSPTVASSPQQNEGSAGGTQPSTSSAKEPARLVFPDVSRQLPKPKAYSRVLAPAPVSSTSFAVQTTSLKDTPSNSTSQLDTASEPIVKVAKLQRVVSGDNFKDEDWTPVTPKNVAKNPKKLSDIKGFAVTEAKIPPPAKALPSDSLVVDTQKSNLSNAEGQATGLPATSQPPTPAEKLKQQKMKGDQKALEEERKARDAEDNAVMDAAIAQNKKSNEQNKKSNKVEIQEIYNSCATYVDSHKKFRKMMDVFSITRTNHFETDALQLELLQFHIDHREMDIKDKSQSAQDFVTALCREFENNDTLEAKRKLAMLEAVIFHLPKSPSLILDIYAIQSKRGRVARNEYLWKVVEMIMDPKRAALNINSGPMPGDCVNRQNSNIGSQSHWSIPSLQSHLDYYAIAQSENRSRLIERKEKMEIYDYLGYQYNCNSQFFDLKLLENRDKVVQEHEFFWRWCLISERTQANQSLVEELKIRMFTVLRLCRDPVVLFESAFLLSGITTLKSYYDLPNIQSVVILYLESMFPSLAEIENI